MEASTLTLEELGDVLEQFPVVYEHQQPKAVLVDIAVFKRLMFLLDNLLNRTSEPEDAVLAESPDLHRLVEWVQATAQPSPQWEQELDEL
ncbi:MAG TPA: hypothetical protein PKH77_19285 [Anaerolineae bacterium]|nr:hypothetical protein [Anaerolineae bacterium]